MVGGIILLFVLGLIVTLAWRTRSGVNNFQSAIAAHGVAVAQMEEYLSVYLPAGSVPGPEWLAQWSAKVAQRGASGSFTQGPPDALPYRAESTPEGGVVVNWKSAHNAKNLELRLAEMVQSLR